MLTTTNHTHDDHEIVASNRYHKWYKQRNFSAAESNLNYPCGHTPSAAMLEQLKEAQLTDNQDMVAMLKAQHEGAMHYENSVLLRQRDKHDRSPLHILAGKAQDYSYYLIDVAVFSVIYDKSGLQAVDVDNNTPLDIAKENFACPEIITLLSIPPDVCQFLPDDELTRLYAPVTYWRRKFRHWTESENWKKCNEFVAKMDLPKELKIQVLSARSGEALRNLAEQEEPKVPMLLLVMRMICLSPAILEIKNKRGYKAGAFSFSACDEIKALTNLSPRFVEMVGMSGLVKKFLPHLDDGSTEVHNEICRFIKVIKYDKGELRGVGDVLDESKMPERGCQQCGKVTAKTCARCRSAWFCSGECQKLAWKKHKKVCKEPKQEPKQVGVEVGVVLKGGGSQEEKKMRVLYRGLDLLVGCIKDKRVVGDKPTLLVLEFLKGSHM